MSKSAATVQIEPEARDILVNVLPTFHQCITWAQKLQDIVGGGISIKLCRDFKGSPAVYFWWNGKCIAVIVLEQSGLWGHIGNTVCYRDKGIPVTTTTAWSLVLWAGLNKIVNEELSRLIVLQGKVSNARSENLLP